MSHPVDPQTRLRELARMRAADLHDMYGHEDSFTVCSHPDCVLTRSAAAALPFQKRLCDLLTAIQSQCQGHADEFSQRVWCLADEAYRIAAALPQEEPARHEWPGYVVGDLEEDGDERTAEELTAARAHPHCPDCRRPLEDCNCKAAARGEEPAPPPTLTERPQFFRDVAHVIESAIDLYPNLSRWQPGVPQRLLAFADALEASAALPEARPAPPTTEPIEPPR